MNTRHGMEFVTDTATMCVFDLGALKHRLDDDADWWSDPDEELAEVNAGNVAFLNLGEDGRYRIELVGSPLNDGVVVLLNCPTGRVFLGSGEEVTGDELEPEGVRGGGFVQLEAGSVRLSALMEGDTVKVHFEAINNLTEGNSFAELIRI